MFLFFILLTAVIGLSITFSRNMQFREVTCLKYVDCSQDIIRDNKIKRDNVKCVYIKDSQNLISEGILEFTSPQPNFEESCWTDGIYVNRLNQKNVLSGIIGTIFGLIILYVIVSIFYHYKQKKNGILSEEYQNYVRSYITNYHIEI
jgi:hypothetical protein